MIGSLYTSLINYSRKINWVLLVFLVLVLNVKLIVKVAAIILITLYQFRSVSLKNILAQKQLYFYFSVIAIGLINFVFQLKNAPANYLFTVLLGTGLWIIAAATSFHLFIIIQKEKTEKLFNTITFFFVVHIGTIFLNLLRIMIECGTLNPYTYKGLNQKYYISTGDHMPGITFDSPVTTALISAFALIYFLYRRHFFLSLLAAATLALVGSNLTNISLAVVLVFVFIFRSDRIQKSFIILYLSIIIIFLARISPRDNEYLGRVVYGLIGKTYDLPKKNESIDFIKTQPDSLLDPIERKKKLAKLYIDSISSVRAEIARGTDANSKNAVFIKKDTGVINKPFFEFKEQQSIQDRISKYSLFIRQNYPAATIDSFKTAYDWKKPGKWTAYLELFHFLKEQPGKILTGAGIGNFSSRAAFKVTSLGMAGAYPKKFSYIHPSFLNNHLYLYLNYHSQNQMKHAAANTPDSTYSQLLGEYGIAGLLTFLILYIGFAVRRIRYLSFGIPLLLLLLASFFVEYWFEQLSVVILYEALLFLDLKSNSSGMQPQKEAVSS